MPDYSSIPLISRNRASLLRKLGRKKYRDSEGLFIAEGFRAVSQLLQNRMVSPEFLVATPEAATDLSAVLPSGESSVPVYGMNAGLFSSPADTKNPQGLLGVFRKPEPPAAGFLHNQTGWMLALDGVSDPGNLGTILRTAAWFGVSGVLAGEGTADPYNPKVVRSTAGATAAVPLLEGSLEGLLPGFRDNGWDIFLLDAGPGSENLNKIDLPGIKKGIIVVGNEAHGVQPDILNMGRAVHIPGNTEAVESLNAAVSAAIALHYFCVKF